MRKSNRLPARFPVGAKYVLEARGAVVHRYVELPSGRRVTLPQRKAASCACLALQEISIVPGQGAAAEPARKKKPVTARRRARALERA